MSGNRNTTSLALGGFTLIEVIAVIAIMAVITSASIWTVRAPLRRSQTEHAITQFTSLDAMARRRAGSGQLITLRFDLENQSVTMIDQYGQSVLPPVQFVGDHSLASVVISSREQTLSVNYDSFGTSPTYAVELQTDANMSLWLLVAGLSGETYTLKKLPASKVHEIVQIEWDYAG